MKELVRLKIQNSGDRDDVVKAVASAGYPVKVEAERLRAWEYNYWVIIYQEEPR